MSESDSTSSSGGGDMAAEITNLQKELAELKEARGPRVVVRPETSTVTIFRGKGCSLTQFEEQLQDLWKDHEIHKEEDQLKSLRKHVAKEVGEVLDCYPDNKKRSVKQVLAILKHVYGDARSTSVLLDTFTATRQRPHEPVREYSSRLNKAYKDLVRHQIEADQQPLGDSVLRDHFVENLQDQTLVKHLRDKVHEKHEMPFFEAMEAAVRWTGPGAGPKEVNSQPMGASSTAAPEMVPVLEKLVGELSNLKMEMAKLKKRLDDGSRDQHGGRRPRRLNEFAEDGRPICRKCRDAGHIARNCPLNY